MTLVFTIFYHLFCEWGQIFDFFQLSENMPCLIQFLNRDSSGFTMGESYIFNIFIDISSYKCELHGPRAFITLMISLFLT